MLNLTQMTADLRMVMADIPQTLTLASGVVVSAVVTTGPEADGLSIADVTPERRLTAIVMAADCAVAPEADDVITYSGNRYRVADVTRHDDGLACTIQAAGEWQ